MQGQRTVNGILELVNRLGPQRLLAMGAAALQHVKRYRWEEFVRTIDDALEAWVVEGAVSSANSGDSMSSEDRRFNPAP